MNELSQNFFSISYDLIRTERNTEFDLYVNSSSLENRKKFVRIFPKGGLLTASELKIFKKKYFQLYLHESQREDYLRSLASNDQVSPEQKSEVIKTSAIHYLDKIFNQNEEFTSEILSETIQGCKTTVESMVDVIKGYDVSRLQSLIGSLSYHDFYTFDHSINVSMYCISLYSALKPEAPKEEIVMAGLGGLLHDIGKIKVPTYIINKADKLTDEEFNLIKQHPADGANLLTHNGCSCEGVDLEVIKRVVFEHHENFNGTGYPSKMVGVDIHLLARVTAIADFFDAVTTKRPYHEVLSISGAIDVMSKTVGKKLDPFLFEIFVSNIQNLLEHERTTRELPDDFDPCQPQTKLPFIDTARRLQNIEASMKNEKFGNVKVKAG